MKEHCKLFITATGTGIGKTYVSRLIADTYSMTGRKVSYFKPVQTGCVRAHSGQLRAPDADYVFGGKALNKESYGCHIPYRFEPACSPHLAARLNSESISFSHIKQCLEKVSSGTDLTITEGAGGILVPLDDKRFMLDLMVFLKMPVLLVTSPELGTLNHTLLSLKELTRSGLTIAGCVINNVLNTPDDFIYNDNLTMIRRFFHPAPVLVVPPGGQACDSVKDFCNALFQSI